MEWRVFEGLGCRFRDALGAFGFCGGIASVGWRAASLAT
jgi:hypothetical protein